MERRIVTRAGVGTTAQIIQWGEVLSHRITMDCPILIHVVRGTKILRRQGRETVIPAGEAVAVAGGQTFDIFNQSGPGGYYEARWLMFDQIDLASWSLENPQLPAISELLPLCNLAPEFSRLIASTIGAIEDEDALPLSVASARVREVLAWIGVHGGRFLPTARTSLPNRIRTLLSAQPGLDWTAEKVASHMAMSEATLRRHLAKEGQAFSTLLVEARLSSAFNLILATDQPIDAIARSVGYQSPSRFAARFKALFGHQPTILRGHHREDDRFGTKNDRSAATPAPAPR